MFSSRNKKNITTFWLKKAPYQELWDMKGNIQFELEKKKKKKKKKKKTKKKYL